MTSGWMAIGEFLALDGVVVAWGLWELWSLRRDKTRAAKDGDPNGED